MAKTPSPGPGCYRIMWAGPGGSSYGPIVDADGVAQAKLKAEHMFKDRVAADAVFLHGNAKHLTHPLTKGAAHPLDPLLTTKFNQARIVDRRRSGIVSLGRKFA